jgi:hypothetical protein
LLADLPDYPLASPLLYRLPIERSEDCCQRRNHQWNKRQGRADCDALGELGFLPDLALKASMDKNG